MKLFKQVDEVFASLGFRERVLATAAVVACLGLAGNLLVLKPQMLKISALKQSEESHRSELSKLKQQLDVIRAEKASGIDPFAKEKEQLAIYLEQIKQAESFVGQDDSSASQVGMLVRNLIRANPGLKLVSLKTLKTETFYSPPKKEKKSEVVNVAQKTLANLQSKQVETSAAPLSFVDRELYKHGIEVVVNGTYPALLSYMNEMQKFPKRIFWGDANLDATNFRSANLRLVLYILSDQQVSPLN